MTNIEIVEFHPDLTIEKVESLRAVYDLNGSIRPFKNLCKYQGLVFLKKIKIRSIQTLIVFLKQ